MNLAHPPYLSRRPTLCVSTGHRGRRFLAGFAFLVLLNCGAYAKSPKWEYRVVNAVLNNRALEALLNTNGSERWELVQINDRGTAIFKRPLAK